MRTDEAARILRYTKSYVAQLIRGGKLRAEKIGPRFWDVDPRSVEEYLSAPEGTEALEPAKTADPSLTEEITHSGAGPSQEQNMSGTIESDSEAANLIRELEEDAIVVAGKRVNMAQLFWMLSQFSLDGLEPGSVFPTVIGALPEGNGDERADGANEAVRKLTFKLRTLQLVRNENRQYGLRGYTVVVSTALGARVIRALQTKGWPRP